MQGKKIASITKKGGENSYILNTGENKKMILGGRLGGTDIPQKKLNCTGEVGYTGAAGV